VGNSLGLPADTILVLHVAYVLFVVAGQLLILFGWFLQWSWPRRPVFRFTHLAAIAIVVLQSWLGILCPLTVWEGRLREAAGQSSYDDMSFVGYWLSRFLFYEASPWVFAVCYTLFGALVVASFVFYPPRRTRRPGMSGALLLAGLTFLPNGECVSEEWPNQVSEVRYTSSADGSEQPALFYVPDVTGERPLLVALHTWSDDYRQKMSVPYAQWCIEKGWVFIHPSFRGPNKNPEATGSEWVVHDILDAVSFAKQRGKVDTTRIYLVGASGGGYTALLMDGRAPDVWAGVSAWVPITDLVQWYLDCKKSGRRYADDVVASVGGIPTEDPQAKTEAEKRSPLTYLAGAENVPVDINAGITDGHTGSVPVTHSIRAYNLLAREADRIGDADVATMAEKAEVPAHLRFSGEDPLYGEKKVLLRKSSQKVRLTLFDGGHEIVFEAALHWLARQQKPH